jgi:hypothetical protein
MGFVINIFLSNGVKMVVHSGCDPYILISLIRYHLQVQLATFSDEIQNLPTNYNNNAAQFGPT